MKLLDKFLKFLKTDRNTFFTYILTVITFYLVIDRLVELLFLFFTGTSVSYWGPIRYTLAMACPVFAFLFSGSSKFVKNDVIKLSFFYIYIVSLYIIAISMVVQWINALSWILLMSLPNYAELASNFSELIRPAFTAIALYLPITTFYGLIRWLLLTINDTKDIKDSIFDYGGLDLSNNKEGTGPFTCEVFLCNDKESGKTIKILESRRFESMLVVGPSGSGKTSMVFEPLMARDIEKKYFFKEVSKEMGFTALKTGIATLNCPYSNDYINENFTLDMLTPNQSKEKIYKSYVNKMVYSDSGKYIYKNLGITALSPDYESIKRMVDVANNFNIKFNVIDPNNPDSLGLNPFVYDDPIKTAVAISSVLKGMYFTSNTDIEQAFRENVANQAVENVAILLKEMYPRLNNGDLPNIEDMLKMFNNFDLVEEMCNKLLENEELSDKYSIQIGYFKKNFYRNSPGRADTERFAYAAITQLDNLLRYPGIKNILCNRNNNINYDKVLENGEVTFVCTRRGDLGATAHKAFGLFFLLLMQYSILRRPGNEKTRIPHFLYIDEFPAFICKYTDSIFTLYRKYRVGTIISSQNLDQLGNAQNSKFRQTILANCTTKVVFGNNTPEDNEWWAKEFGDKREWKFSQDYHTSIKDGKTAPEYDENLKGISWSWKKNFEAGKVQSLKFKQIIYKTKDTKGKNIVGAAKLDYLETKYKQQQQSKTYNFEKYSSGISSSKTSINKKETNKSNYKQLSNKLSEEDSDPIQTDMSDSKFLFDNEDAIIVNLKKGNPNG